MNPAEHAVPEGVFRLQRIGVFFVVVGALACVVGAFIQPDQFFRSYLFGFLFWAFLALGATGLLMIQHLSGGMWGMVNRRTLEAASRTAPLLALLFLPVAFGVYRIYSWAGPEAAADAVLKLKAPYLNVPFFLGRAALYFVLWMVIVYFLNRWSLQQDEGGDPSISERLENLSGGGLIGLALIITFASIDWAMSLSPHWFSTIYGVLFMVGGILSAWSFAIILIAVWGSDEPFDRVANPNFIHDMGKFLLTFVMLWAYINLSQFLIIWSGNLPEETPWYMVRMKSPYVFLGQVLVVFHFALPFLILLSRSLKRARRRLAIVATLVFLMRVLDLLWVVGPEIHPGLAIHWLDIAAWAAAGGAWVVYFTAQLAGRPLLPVGEPEIQKLLQRAP